MRHLLLRMKILVEPSGAVAAAAAIYRRFPPELKRIGVILRRSWLDFDLAIKAEHTHCDAGLAAERRTKTRT